MFKKAYGSYVEKCSELGVSPSSIDEIFGSEIEKSKRFRDDISELSSSRKSAKPKLSESAKVAIECQTTSSVNKKKSNRKEVKKKIEVVLSDDEKREIRNARARARYLLNKPPVKDKVILSDEERKAIAKEKRTAYYLRMKDDPVYSENRRIAARKWKKNNKEKVKAAHEKWRSKELTPKEVEEQRSKERAYRKRKREEKLLASESN